MAKKYLSLEEAADRLGVSVDALTELREQGVIRGFADRGSWKFREQEVEEYIRSEEADSTPDIPIVNAPTDDGDSDPASSDSDVRLSFDESLFDDDDDVLSGSDSDVRLAGDSDVSADDEDLEATSVLNLDESEKTSDSDSDVQLVDTDGSSDNISAIPPGDSTDAEIETASANDSLTESDSDVRLAEDSDLLLSDSDSDVRLSEDDNDDLLPELDSDSDVHLVDAGSGMSTDEDSDSDVKLGLDRTDSDIRLVDADSLGDRTEPSLNLPEDSDLKLIDSDTEDPGSGLTLEPSGIELDADESGISLEIDDSGISLEADDSGISLESLDSGASLADDSGITLDAGDSGIALFGDDDDDSGLALEEADMGSTMPMQAIPGAADAMAESGAQTMQMDISDAEQNDSEFELAGLEDDDDDFGTDTSVLMFDDEEDAAGSNATIQAPAADDFAEESFADEEGFDEFEDDFEEEELDDVWDAEEELDDDEFDEGESQVGGFTAPAAARVYSASDAPWGAGWTTAVTFTTLFSVVSAFVGIELVRTMWVWTQPGESGSMLLDTLGGIFGS